MRRVGLIYLWIVLNHTKWMAFNIKTKVLVSVWDKSLAVYTEKIGENGGILKS